MMNSELLRRRQSDITTSGELISASHSCNPEDQRRRTAEILLSLTLARLHTLSPMKGERGFGCSSNHGSAGVDSKQRIGRE